MKNHYFTFQVSRNNPKVEIKTQRISTTQEFQQFVGGKTSTHKYSRFIENKNKTFEFEMIYNADGKNLNLPRNGTASRLVGFDVYGNAAVKKIV